MIRVLKNSIVILIAITTLPKAESAAAPKSAISICKTESTGAISVRSGRCKRTESKISNISQLKGADGANGTDGRDGSNGSNGSNGLDGTDGADGADGSLRVYGDGSAGDLTASFSSSISSTNTQYTNVTINNGATLFVPSGTVIRCTGNFINNGTITVGDYAVGGFIGFNSNGAGSTTQLAIASPGISPSIASQGAFGTNAVLLSGGPGGLGIGNLSLGTAAPILRPGPNGGGGGGAGFSSGGGNGGGTLTVLCAGSITNNGTISANGADPNSAGAGGGAGGIIILASKSSVSNSSSGTISVNGGAGGPSSSSSGAGGGGGGGFIHLMSPTAPTNSGVVNFTGGAAGSNAVAVSQSPRVGGAGGGSCYGAGGRGSQVSTDNVSSTNTVGSSGTIYSTTADPTSLF